MSQPGTLRSIPRRNSAAWARINIAVAVTEQARGRIHEVRLACRGLGLEVTDTLTEIGVLLGSLEVSQLPRIRSIPEVLAVEIERVSLLQAFEPERPALQVRLRDRRVKVKWNDCGAVAPVSPDSTRSE